MKEIVPQFGILEGMSSGNGPYFIAEVVQGAAKFLQIKWDLRGPWRLQSRGKAEQMDPALKRQVLKLHQDSHEMGRCITSSINKDSGYS